MATPFFLPHMGGVERCVDLVSRRLVQQGIRVTVLTTDPTHSLPPHEVVAGVEIIRVRAWPKHRDYCFAPGVYRTIASKRWSVVHVHSYHTFVAPLAMLAALRHEIPCVVTFHAGGHSSRVRRALRPSQWALLRPLLARVDRLVAIADFEIDLYARRLKVPRGRFVLIPLGTDFGRQLSEVSEAETTDTVIASVGRLERYKGHHRLIEALPEILKARPEARVWIAGEGPYEKALRQLARKLGVAESVEIRAVPADQPHAMAAELLRVSLVVLLSDYETQPNALLEAVALRRPVLVRRNSGLAELADRGLVRAIGDTSGPREIAAAVIDQLRDPFVPRHVDLPSWEECAASHHELYRSVVRGVPTNS